VGGGSDRAAGAQTGEVDPVNQDLSLRSTHSPVWFTSTSHVVCKDYYAARILSTCLVDGRCSFRANAGGSRS